MPSYGHASLMALQAASQWSLLREQMRSAATGPSAFIYSHQTRQSRSLPIFTKVALLHAPVPEPSTKMTRSPSVEPKAVRPGLKDVAVDNKYFIVRGRLYPVFTAPERGR